ncbi:MAG: NAD-dependent deacylase [Chloroflexota bacterium]|nr:MAG: NAD-dependent protein deacylase [Chloroflexota bacterium]
MSVSLPDELIARLRTARRVAALTGAGVSAESGVPTFRDAQTGLWARYNPEELATPQAFRRNPRLVWEWYAYRRSLVEAAEPNPAHHALAELERRIERFTLITQNVDGLHRRAGSRNVVELHGSLTRYRCSAERGCGSVEAPVEDGSTLPPRCPQCGAYLRPDVVWFGESLPAEAWEAAQQAAASSEVFLCIGTSALVQPAAALPLIARRSGAYVAEVNLQPSALDGALDAHLYGPAGVLLPALVAALANETDDGRRPSFPTEERR